jgi:ATP-dependent Zn protease
LRSAAAAPTSSASREARRKARRDRRPLAFADLVEAFGGEQLARPPEVRRRMAVHEAGHVLVHQALDQGTISLISIEVLHGGVVRTETVEHSLQTEGAAMAMIAVKLGGRAAELLVFGDPIAGSGGLPESDLAAATAVAVEMETSLGFSRRRPLLYRRMADRSHLLTLDRELAADVNARLEHAHDEAIDILMRHRDAHLWLADEIERRGVLDNEVLDAVIAELRERIDSNDESANAPARAAAPAHRVNGSGRQRTGRKGPRRHRVPPEDENPPAL